MREENLIVLHSVSKGLCNTELSGSDCKTRWGWGVGGGVESKVAQLKGGGGGAK